MVEMLVLQNRQEWLKERSKRIGGSEAASIVGMNPYQNNVQLWEIKTKTVKTAEIENEFTNYGKEAEKYLRKLFVLDFPQYKVEYVENNLFINDRYPFAHASLDGWLTDQQGRRGILEIKTANVESSMQNAKWRNRLPDNYFCQLCWYMGVYESDFAILKAQLKNSYSTDITTKHYFIERQDVQEDIDYLLQKGSEFWEYCKNNIQPPLVLPVI